MSEQLNASWLIAVQLWDKHQTNARWRIVVGNPVPLVGHFQIVSMIASKAEVLL